MEKMNREEFIKELKKINISLSNKQLDQLEKFYNLLVEWNQKINLTRIIEKEEVYLKHFYDSLTLNRVVDLKNVDTLCDIGTGAGFPGIVLKIAFPNLKVTLVDSLQKRVNYLNEVIKELELDNIEAIHVRGEEFKGSFDVVTSRAVANIEKLVNYTMHLISKDGVFVAMKGDIDNELTSEIEKKLNKKYRIIQIEKFLLPYEDSNRSLIVMKNK
ncbi:MAG: 16S rRNA (guanine(527)-N(7))-methyltransferase RsmG [Bacilli bacterium]|nr:16S rRNA (guanine(527)-N(7))-methyltransferase RsmG [Bacilli bacterium]